MYSNCLGVTSHDQLDQHLLSRHCSVFMGSAWTLPLAHRPSYTRHASCQKAVSGRSKRHRHAVYPHHGLSTDRPRPRCPNHWSYSTVEGPSSQFQPNHWQSTDLDLKLVGVLCAELCGSLTFLNEGTRQGIKRTRSFVGVWHVEGIFFYINVQVF